MNFIEGMALVQLENICKVGSMAGVVNAIIDISVG